MEENASAQNHAAIRNRSKSVKLWPVLLGMRGEQPARKVVQAKQADRASFGLKAGRGYFIYNRTVVNWEESTCLEWEKVLSKRFVCR